MKLKKIISSLLVAAMAMSMSVAAFATEYLYFGQAEYVEGQNITVNLYFHEDVKKIDGMNALGISYSADAFKFVSGSTIVTTATVAEAEDGVVTYIDDGSDYFIVTDPSTPFITMVFEVEDPAKVDEVPFEVISDENAGRTMFGLYVGENEESIFIMSDAEKEYLGSMTVTKKAPVTPEPPVDPEPPVQEEPETGDVIEVDGKTAVIDDAGKTRFVVEDTKASVGKTTAASILKVTYAGTTKQANLWNLLKVEEGATGEIAIGNLTVKVILGTDVIDANSVGSLSIAVQ